LEEVRSMTKGGRRPQGKGFEKRTGPMEVKNTDNIAAIPHKSYKKEEGLGHCKGPHPKYLEVQEVTWSAQAGRDGTDKNSLSPKEERLD